MAETPVPRATDGSPLPRRELATYPRDLRAMFAHIARGYEWFDHVASLGQDFLWRPQAFWAMDRFRDPEVPVRRVLDLGCGTGELARLTAHRYPGAEVVAVDFTAEMLAHAVAGTPSHLAPRLRYARADAQRLPFRGQQFDLVVSAFVARNLPDLPGALAEMRRVLRPDGSLMILDITGPTDPWMRKLFLAYFGRVVPWLGAAVGSEGPYTYLPRSLAHLPPPQELLGWIRKAGFPRAVARPFSGGIVTAFLAGTSPPGQQG